MPGCAIGQSSCEAFSPNPNQRSLPLSKAVDQSGVALLPPLILPWRQQNPIQTPQPLQAVITDPLSTYPSRYFRDVANMQLLRRITEYFCRSLDRHVYLPLYSVLSLCNGICVIIISSTRL